MQSRSSHHVEGGGQGRCSSCNFLGALDAGEWIVSCGVWCGLHWCSWCNVAVGLGALGLAGLDGHHGLADWDLSSTAAESGVAGALTSLWSHGTVGESLLTSGAGLACSWCGGLVLGDECLDGGESGCSGGLGGGKGLLVLVEFSLLACDDGSELLGLGSGQSFSSIVDQSLL